MAQLLDEIEACVPALRRYARALTHDPNGADDLVQDCLERAIRKRGLWRPTGPLKTWLFRILLNIYRSDLRHRRRTPVSISLDTLKAEPSDHSGPATGLVLAETARAMKRLAPEQRQALLLVAVEQLSYAEAAATLGIPIGTLMSRLARARQTLRRLTETPAPRLRTVK